MKYFILVIILATIFTSAYASDNWKLSVGYETRFRFEQRNNKDWSSDIDDVRNDLCSRSRINIKLFDEKTGNEFFIQPQYTFMYTQTPENGVEAKDFDLHQVYVDWYFNKDKTWHARIGRSLDFIGDGRLIGYSNWSNYCRSFDGIRVYQNTPNGYWDYFAIKLGHVVPKTTDPDIYGVHYNWKNGKPHTTDILALYKDERTSSALSHVYTLSARTDGKFKNGLCYNGEAAYQFGTYDSRDIQAYAYHAHLGYVFDHKIKPKLMIETNYASGGPSTGTYRTFDQHFMSGHGKFGLADMQGWKNMRNVRAQISATPSNQWNACASYYWFWLADKRDAWYSTSGSVNKGVGGVNLRDSSGLSGDYIGTELDFEVTYTPNKNMNFSAGYARFMPGSFVKNVGGYDDTMDWWYFQATFKQ